MFACRWKNQCSQSISFTNSNKTQCALGLWVTVRFSKKSRWYVTCSVLILEHYLFDEHYKYWKGQLPACAHNLNIMQQIFSTTQVEWVTFPFFQIILWSLHQFLLLNQPENSTVQKFDSFLKCVKLGNILSRSMDYCPSSGIKEEELVLELESRLQ